MVDISSVITKCKYVHLKGLYYLLCINSFSSNIHISKQISGVSIIFCHTEVFAEVIYAWIYICLFIYTKITKLLRLDQTDNKTRNSLRFITIFIWVAFAAFFRKKVQTSINEICPHGKLSAIGGKKKRNIQSLGMVHGAKLSCKLLSQNHNIFTDAS